MNAALTAILDQELAECRDLGEKLTPDQYAKFQLGKALLVCVESPDRSCRSAALETMRFWLNEVRHKN